MPDTHDTRASSEATTGKPRLPASDEVLRACPAKGKFDYTALIRDTIAKFPKILAALAK